MKLISNNGFTKSSLAQEIAQKVVIFKDCLRKKSD